MADALLSIVLERLASVTEQQLRNELTLVLGVEAEIQSLPDTLRSIRSVLEEAERRQVKDISVQDWLEKLKDIAYQMDDMVDEWSSAIILRSQQIKKKKVSFSSSSSSSWIPSPCRPCLICFKQVAYRRDIALKIKAIKLQLDVIDSDRSRFNFAPISSCEERPQRLITTSAIDISEVCGRDTDIDTILDHVLGRSCSRKFAGLYIISIVGTGGMGKTTLAQLAYNHPEVKAHFHERIWVCVSDPFDPIRVFRSIVEILQKKSCNLHDLEALHQEVQTCVAGKKLLLVLDDVWTEDYRLWEQLKNTLNNNGVAESRILVTTRKENVVMMTGTTHRHPIGELSSQHAQMLFHQIAFRGKSREKEEELKEIGEKIAHKCKGLPLALKTLGNLMRLKNSKEEWEAVLNNEVWKLDVFKIDISPALLLSYYELPPAVKRCFSYCAVFPKDAVIEVDTLIKLWMAQSYLNSDAASKEMETVGREYFNYLAAGSFFQDFEKDDEGHVMRCKMHDVVHDLAQILTKNECFSMEDDINQNEGSSSIDLSFQKRRHATIILPGKALNFVSTYKMKNLRTLLLEWEFNSTISEALPSLFRYLTRLRALDLRSNLFMKQLPKEVGELIHLRYLNLSECAELESLPETICGLHNLQTLNISGCRSLHSLPRAMDKLINLRHLENFGTTKLRGLPEGIGRLKFLRTLDEFRVSDGNEEEYCKIEDLRHLNDIRGKLEIRRLGKVKSATQAKRAEMKNKMHLHHLRFDFGGGEGRKGVAEALQPHSNLKSLYISGYGDVEWPNWMMMMTTTSSSLSLAQLKILELCACRNCSYMPPLGELPLLEELIIWAMDSVKCLGGEFLGSSTISFPKLKKLSFNGMEAWEKWEMKEGEEERSSVMPSLCYLKIFECPKLEGLPDQLLNIKTPLQELVIIDSNILQKRYEKDNGEDWHKVSHIPLLKTASSDDVVLREDFVNLYDIFDAKQEQLQKEIDDFLRVAQEGD